MYHCDSNLYSICFIYDLLYMFYLKMLPKNVLNLNFFFSFFLWHKFKAQAEGIFTFISRYSA